MQTTKDQSFTIETATCGGYHVKHNGRTVRQQDHKPLLFKTQDQAQQYVNGKQEKR